MRASVFALLISIPIALSLPANADPIQLPGVPKLDPSLAASLRQAAAVQLKETPPRTKHLNADGSPKYINRLILESSPYLQQHAFNPVNWYPWGDEAFAAAKRENKPVFLSIGYSTCHWCHVMEEESFDNEDIARRLNEGYIAIKVDREARPDVDAVYIDAVTKLTRSAGWPLTVFLTPDRQPFYGGTYFPPEDRHGRPGMPRLLESIGKLWRQDPHKATAAAADLTAALRAQTAPAGSLDLGLETLQRARAAAARSFDTSFGGFGRAPKFPQAHGLTFLARDYNRSGAPEPLRMAESTLDHMAGGGIHDQIGGGLHRYSVDREWRVPHFEKMLYDQAINGRAYLEVFAASGHARHAEVARGIFTYVLRDLTAPGGGFYAAEDADSEGEEGIFYLWKRDQIIGALGRKTGELVADFYGVTPERSGSPSSLQSLPDGLMPLYVPMRREAFAKARNIATEELNAILERTKTRLLAVRSKRPRPFRDDKIITAWNGLMISTLAYGAVVLGQPEYADAAGRAADFILAHGRKNGRLARFHRGEAADIDGYLDDYAFLLLGLTDLYEATFDIRRLRQAQTIAKEMLRLFSDEKTGGLRYSADDHETLFATPNDFYDGALPSAQSVAALALLQLGRLTMNEAFEARARAIIAVASQEIARAPLGHTQMLIALDFVLGPTKEIVALVPFLAKQGMRGGKPTAYVCENYACDLPTSDPAKLQALLQKRWSASPPPDSSH